MDGKARLLRTGDGPARRELCDYRLAKTTADIRYECTQQLALSETLEADGPYFCKILKYSCLCFELHIAILNCVFSQFQTENHLFLTC